MKPSFKQQFSVFVHSIRFRLMLWYAAILAIVLFAFSAFVFFNQVNDIRGEANYRIEHRMSGVLDELVEGKNIPLLDREIFIAASPEGKIIALQGLADGNEALQLLAKIKVGLAGNHTDGRFNSTIMKYGETVYVFGYRLIVDSFGKPAGVVILGTPFDPYELTTRLLFTLAIGSLLTLAVALGGGWWLADRAMRPVHTITQTARSISESDLSRRINLKSRDELGELANTFDAMLDRIESAFERQRQFVADASHELRTPLTIVNLETSRALSAKRKINEYERALTVIQGENEFMTRLVTDLLTLARLDAGQVTLKHEPLDLSDIALDAAERLSPLAERFGVVIETGELPETPLTGDRQSLIQMVSNLIENGIKYAGGEGKSVRVETGQDNESAWVSVSDNGPGIPPENLPHIFDRFYRVDKARTRSDDDDATGGSGLGLSIVQMIAHAHGGEAMVESEAGVGANFVVRFKTNCSTDG